MNSPKMLIAKFNDRDQAAFGEIYLYFYDDLCRYIEHLYRGFNNTEAEDIIQDIFLDLWKRKQSKFDSLIKIKGYLIISIHNHFKNDLRHNKYVNEYHDIVEQNLDYNILEFEIYSIFHKIKEMLPSESAEILKLYFEGYKPAEIAKMLNKSPQVVYNKKNEALSILRTRMGNDKTLLLIQLLLMN